MVVLQGKEFLKKLKHTVINEYGSDPRSYEHTEVVEKIRPEKIQARTGVEPMTSVKPVLQRSWVMARGHGFKSRTGLKFFLGPIFTSTSVVFRTARITSIFVSSTAVHIYDFHVCTDIYTVTNCAYK